MNCLNKIEEGALFDANKVFKNKLKDEMKALIFWFLLGLSQATIIYDQGSSGYRVSNDPGGPCVPSGISFPCDPSYDESVILMQEAADNSEGEITMHSAGYSIEGRELWYVRIGSGPIKYMFWGRLHGDECEGGNVALEVLETMTKKGGLPKRIREDLTIILIPNWNPDGVVLGTRRTAPFPGFPNGIDLNRDWVPHGVIPSPGTFNFEAPESNYWYDLYIAEQPDFVVDIHQFGGIARTPSGQRVNSNDILWNRFLRTPYSTRVPLDEGDPVQIQLVSFFFNQFASEEVLFRSLQMAQLMLDEALSHKDTHVTRWNLTASQFAPPRSASARMVFDGLRNISEPGYVVKGGLGIELRRVFPEYKPYIVGLGHDIMMDQFRALVYGHLTTTNPAPMVELPFAVTEPCSPFERGRWRPPS